MKQSKNTKRALTASILSMIVCCAMLIGSTFAWFTDSVTSSGNVIQSGNLDVAMEWANGTEALDAAEWNDASGTAIFGDDVLWEPGYTEARHVRISNKGNLALKYEIRIVPTGEVDRLAEVIDVYYIEDGQQLTDRAGLADLEPIGTLADVLKKPYAAKGHISGKNGEVVSSDVATIALKMQESAGNEYKDQSIGDGFAIKLLATQYTEENDSFDNQYDKDAEYPIVVNDAEDLRDAIKAENAKIILADNIEVIQEALTVNKEQTIEIDLDGKTVDIPQGSTENICSFINNGGNLTLKNGFIRNGDITDGNYNADSPNRNAAIESYGGTLMLENCVISNSAGNNGSYAVKIANDPEGNGCVASFKNCEITGTRGGLNAMGNAEVNFDGGSIKAGYFYPFYIDGNATAEFNDTEFIKAAGTAGGNFIVYSAAYVYETGEATFNNCTFKSERTGTKFLTWWTGGKKIPFAFNGCTFDNVIDNYNE